MTIALLGSFSGILLGWLMGFLSIFLILLILIQRGKGGGLTGALGGPGGQSAFGSKAGDTFTVITIVAASIWGFTCAFTMWLLGTHAPTIVTETTVKAGPGDESQSKLGNELIIPPAGSGGIGGLGGLDLGGDAAEKSTSETPSMELTPAKPAAESGSSAETPASPQPESTTPDSPATNSAAPDAPTADAPTADAPAADAPAADATEPEAKEGTTDRGSDEN